MSTSPEGILEYIMERVVPGKEAEAKKLLQDAYQKYMFGTLNAAAVQELIPKLMEVIKPENQAEIKSQLSQIL